VSLSDYRLNVPSGRTWVWCSDPCLTSLPWSMVETFPRVLATGAACPGDEATTTPLRSVVRRPEPKPCEGSAAYCARSRSVTTRWFSGNCSGKPMNVPCRQQHTLFTNSIIISVVVRHWFTWRPRARSWRKFLAAHCASTRSRCGISIMLLAVVHSVRCDTSGLRFSWARWTSEILECTGDARCMYPPPFSESTTPWRCQTNPLTDLKVRKEGLRVAQLLRWCYIGGVSLELRIHWGPAIGASEVREKPWRNVPSDRKRSTFLGSFICKKKFYEFI